MKPGDAWVTAYPAPDHLRRSEEVFFTSATTEVRATVRLDGWPIGTSRAGPVTRRLRTLLRGRIAQASPPTPAQ